MDLNLLRAQLKESEEARERLKAVLESEIEWLKTTRIDNAAAYGRALLIERTILYFAKPITKALKTDTESNSRNEVS